MSNKTTPVVVSSEDPKPKFPRPKRFIKAGLAALIVILVVIAGIWKAYDAYVNRPITIGDSRITKQEIQAYAAEVAKYTASHHENFGGTPTQVADNDLILNAALKDQAAKHNITLTQSDIDSALQSKYKAYGSKQAYQAALQALGIASIMKVRDQNTAYEAKLQDVLIAKKQLFMVGIYYDAPYFGGSNNQAALRAQATQTIKTKFLPLFQQHLSKEAIGKQTTVDTLNPNSGQTDNSKLFFTGMPVTDMLVQNYSTATPFFNDSGGGSVPGAKSTNQAADSLTKVGQYTPVETFQAGFIGIIRLESQTKGAYNSWDQLLQQYKAKYAKSLAFNQSAHQTIARLPGELAKPFATLLRAGESRVFPDADAASCNAVGGASAHYATFYIRSFDMTTGAQLPPAGHASQIGGAYVKETRSVASTGGGLACANRDGVVVDDNNPNTGTTSLNNLIFEDNCWDSPPTWSQSAPAGFTWQPSDDVSRNITIASNGWPDWSNGNINAVGNIDFSLAYKPIIPPPPTWNLSGSSNGSAGTVQPGESLDFYHTVTNQGPDAAKYGWHVQQGSNPSGPFTDITGVNNVSGVSKNGKNPNNYTDNQTPWPGNTGAGDGAQYCQRIAYSNATGPSTSSAASPAYCVTLHRSSSPVITCNFTFVPEPDSQPQVTPPGSPSDGSSWSKSTANVPTGALVSISGTNASPSSYWQGQTVNPDTYHTPYTMNYSPTGNTVTVNVAYYENALEHNGHYQWVELTSTSTSRACYSATANTPSGACSLAVSGGQGPGGVIEAGQQVSVSGQIWNYPDGGNPYKITLPANMPNGDPLSLTFNGGPHAVGYALTVGQQSAPIDLGSIQANPGPNPSTETISAYPDYYGTGAIGPACSISFPVYASFTLTPMAQTIASPSLEDPNQIINNTWVTESGAPVNENVTSKIYENPVGGGTIANGNTSNPGTFNPNTSTCLYQGAPPYNVPAAPPYSACAPSYSGTYAPTLPLNAGDNYCSEIYVPTATGGWVGPGGDIVGGTYADASNCQTIENKPFFKVYNGSVEAGGAFKATTPSCSGGGNLGGWNNNTGTWPTSGDFGAGAQIGALSLGPNIGVASNQESLQSSPTGLSFANSASGDKTSDTYNPKLGGNFDTPNGSYCLTDVTPPIGVTPTAGPKQISGMTISPGANQNQSVFVNGANGNVYITGNILYKGDNGLTGKAAAWTDPSRVPSFVVHATGNIYIDPSVTELDGLYEAQGKIYTCGAGQTAYADGTVPPSPYAGMAANELYDNCHKQLTVYGNMVANQIDMGRAFGSLRDETPVGATGASGSTGPLIWSCGGSICNPSLAGDSCVAITEPAEPAAHTWTDNNLCVSGTDSGAVKLGWTDWAGSPYNNPSTLPADLGPGRLSLSYYQSQGLTNCTSWNPVNNAPYNYPAAYGWSDNYLCSNVPVHFYAGSHVTGANEFCTPVTEPSDTEGNDVWNSSTICVDKGTVASPAHAPTPPLTCSNAVPSSGWSTCAAEIFYFTPELYISKPNIGSPSQGASQWNAITGLPPLL